jgi:hypothetical protein
LTFSEPWSKNLKIDKSTFRPIEDPLTDFGDYEDHESDSADLNDPNTRPDISIYEPITFEEILESPIDFAGEIDWDDFKPYILKSCKEFLDLWSKEIRDNVDIPLVISEEDNQMLLGVLKRLLVGYLALYSEVTDFCRWLVEAYERLEDLQNKYEVDMLSRIFQKSRARQELKIKIEGLTKEIDDFEEEWGILERIYEFEEYLLESYVKTVITTQKRIQKHRKNKISLGLFGPKPQSREILNSYDFEHYCRDWLSYLGGRNALVSGATQDGGVDIISDGHVAQVKLYNGAVPVSQIRDLLGTSVDFGKKPIFFASMAFSKGSIEFADRNNIPLIVVDSYNGVLRGANHFGTTLIGAGIPHQD